jgi:hypothetical protein
MKAKRISFLRQMPSLAMVLSLTLAACTAPVSAPTPVPTNTPSATPPPTSTPTATPSPTPTATPTPSPSQIAETLGLPPDATFPRAYQITEGKLVDQYGIVWAQIVNEAWQLVTDADQKYQNIGVVKTPRDSFIEDLRSYDLVLNYKSPHRGTSKMYVTATGNYRDRSVPDPTDLSDSKRTITVTDVEVAFVDPISGRIRTTYVVLCSPDLPGDKRVDTMEIVGGTYYINEALEQSYDETKRTILPGTQILLFFMTKRTAPELPRLECYPKSGYCTHEYWLNVANFFQNQPALKDFLKSVQDPNATELTISPDLTLSQIVITMIK